MRFSDFRPGNICYKLTNLDDPVIITEINSSYVKGIHIKSREKVGFITSVLKSVKLNEKILKYLRFTKVDRCYVYDNCWVHPGALNPTSFAVEFENTRDTIEFLHELQNLYKHERKEELYLPFLKK